MTRLYDSQSKKFVRNKTLEAISGYPNRYPHKKQLYLNKDALLERVNDQWKKHPVVMLIEQLIVMTK